MHKLVQFIISAALVGCCIQPSLATTGDCCTGPFAGPWLIVDAGTESPTVYTGACNSSSVTKILAVASIRKEGCQCVDHDGISTAIGVPVITCAPSTGLPGPCKRVRVTLSWTNGAVTASGKYTCDGVDCFLGFEFGAASGPTCTNATYMIDPDCPGCEL